MRKAMMSTAAVLGLLALSACESETGPATDPEESDAAPASVVLADSMIA